MNLMMDAIRPGVTEAAVVAEGVRHLVANGGCLYDVAITAGHTSDQYHEQMGPPHWDHRRKLEAGEMIHVDMWGPVERYFTDFARSTVVGGRATDAQREILEAPLAAIAHLLDGICPGVKVADLFDRGERWMKDNGWLDPSLRLADAPKEAGPLLEHAPIFGHGIGMGNERPWIVFDSPFTIERNMVLAIEFIVARDGEGAYLEHDVLVTEDGVEVLDAGCKERWW
jgi:Xaa-Pro aminopeptidase